MHLIPRLDLRWLSSLIQQTTEAYLRCRDIVGCSLMSVVNCKRVVRRSTIPRQLRMSGQVQRQRNPGRKSMSQLERRRIGTTTLAGQNIDEAVPDPTGRSQ
jgi:hypothetical protein